MKKLLLLSVFFLSVISFSADQTDVDSILSQLNEVAQHNMNEVENSVRDKIIDFAKNNLEIPYEWGAEGPHHFDCSGFVQYVFGENTGIDLPRVSRDMAKFAEASERKGIDDLKVGDLIFFNTARTGTRVNHVGIYLGEGEFIHASSAKKKVIISNLKTGFYRKAFKWGLSPFQY